MARVTVVGGGVAGLTTAVCLRGAGHAVTCVRDSPTADTVSAVAGGLWFPYRAEPRDRVVAWGATTLERFTTLATEEAAAGVALREGLLVERGRADRWWTEGLASWRPAGRAELPAGATGGVVATVPLVTMSVFLGWLEERCGTAGVTLVDGHVDDVEGVDADVVVVAAGLASGALMGDDALVASRGQVALLANPGITRWLVDDEHPDGMIYALPHPGWVVCGGTDVAAPVTRGAPATPVTEPDAGVHEAIIARVRAAVPELAGAQVLGSRVGLRPVAPAVRLERHQVGGREVVTNYGHGGAGVTLSWGCAEEVVRLVGEASG